MNLIVFILVAAVIVAAIYVAVGTKKASPEPEIQAEDLEPLEMNVLHAPIVPVPEVEKPKKIRKAAPKAEPKPKVIKKKSK